METKIDPGTEIGSYRIESLLGRGGMAEVYKAWNIGLHRHEALKLLPSQMTFDQSFVERFLNEARMAAKLRHPHIATIHTVSPATETRPYFAMELVDGGDLSDLLHLRGAIPLREAVLILRQIASALDYAHQQGIIHRDVKPANILLESDGKGSHIVKVVDFGIARAQEAEDGARLTKTGMIVGTPEYMSPEQGGSGAKVGSQSDQYSLGIVAYELLCKRPPFAVSLEGTAMTIIMSHIRDIPRAPMNYVPGLSLSANNAILRALSKKPEDRFASCSEFIAAMEATTSMSIPISSSPNASVQRKTVRAIPLIIGSAAIMGAILMGIGFVHSHNSQLHEDVERTNFSYSLASVSTVSKPKAITYQRLSATHVPEVSEQAVNDLLSKWLASQNERNVTSYASLYAPDFVGIKRTSHGQKLTYHLAAWVKDRSKMLTNTDNLTITIANQKTLVRPGGSQVSFNQYFKTSKYGDWGPKVIQVRATPQGLLIYREEMLRSYPLK